MYTTYCCRWQGGAHKVPQQLLPGAAAGVSAGLIVHFIVVCSSSFICRPSSGFPAVTLILVYSLHHGAYVLHTRGFLLLLPRDPMQDTPAGCSTQLGGTCGVMYPAEVG
jgi:hypothetical protein